MSAQPQSQVPPGGWDRPVAGPPPLAAPYAGWWSRVGASLFDLLVISIPAALLAILLFGGIGAAFSTDDGFGVVTLVLGLITYVGLLLAALAPVRPASDAACG